MTFKDKLTLVFTSVRLGYETSTDYQGKDL